MAETRRTNLPVVLRTGAAILLLLPLLAMQFTDEVNWTLSDFVVFAALLAGVVAGFEFVAKRSSDATYRLAAGIALLSGFLLLWINGAVGIVGDEGNPVNRLFPGVIAVAIAGALIARLRPLGMSRAMLATAVAQIAAAATAMVVNAGGDGAFWLAEPLVLSAFFVLLWLASSRLFRRCAGAT